MKLPAEMDLIFMESFRVPGFLKLFIIFAVVKLQLLRIIHLWIPYLCFVHVYMHMRGWWFVAVHSV